MKFDEVVLDGCVFFCCALKRLGFRLTVEIMLCLLGLSSVTKFN